ncbi:MAG: Ig-like domain-containing protein [Bacteroidales bacterium]|nr:Ig-like domain-containing protein [Bacteroidales bacterium]
MELNESSLQIQRGSTAQLIATVAPEDASNNSVVWSSSDDSIAAVSDAGVVSGVGVGTAEIMVTTMDGGFAAKCIITVTYPDLTELGKTFVPVDLGLPSGLKWGSFNLGATKPEEYGDYFAWGETVLKAKYSWSTYKFELGTDSNGPFSKYVTNSSYGTVDNKTVLEPEDDAAAVNLGGSWRMPTRAEQDELRSQCTWTWTTQNGVNGRLVTGPNGNSIFLPAAGYRDGTSLSFAGSNGCYWSSSLYMYYSYYAYYASFGSGFVDWSGSTRFTGFSVRPVSE